MSFIDGLRGKNYTPVFLVKTGEWVYLIPYAFSNGSDYLSMVESVDEVQ